MFVYEGGAHVWRNIWMDGREQPKDPNPDYLGYSVGKWEGDTLVVDTIGMNDRTWLDAAGHGHGEKLHVTERFTRTDSNTLKIEATIDDPDYYTKPWTVVTQATWMPNRGDPGIHLPGKQSRSEASGGQVGQFETQQQTRINRRCSPGLC